MHERRRGSGPLRGIRVLELSAVVAGPTAAQVMGDLGADVIKVEPPSGDPVRMVGASKGEVPLWWKHLGRNKRSIGIDLSQPAGRSVLLQLVDKSDVLIESFRPGTLERWDLAPAELLQRNPDLVVARISGFGREGPLAEKPAFGTLIEAISGFASINGAADGPPTLPPVALADYLTGYAAVIAVLAALNARNAGHARGQVVEVNLLRSLSSIMNLQILQVDQLGVRPRRVGSRMTTTAPRNVYETADGRWIAVSGTTLRTAATLMELAGHPEMTAAPWFGTGAGRFAHADELDGAMREWIGDKTMAEVLAEAERAGATLAPVNDVAELLADPAVRGSGVVCEVSDPDLGDVLVPDVICDMSATPGAVEWLGEGLGSSTEEIIGELSLAADEVLALRQKGVIV